MFCCLSNELSNQHEHSLSLVHDYLDDNSVETYVFKKQEKIKLMEKILLQRLENMQENYKL